MYQLRVRTAGASLLLLSNNVVESKISLGELYFSYYQGRGVIFFFCFCFLFLDA